MGAFTYCYDHEVKNWETVPDDKDLNKLLQDVRNTISKDWYLQVQTHQPRKRLFHKQKPAFKTYTLYFYTGAGIEYQVINLVTENEAGSVFTSANRSQVMNFLMGMLNGWEDHARKHPPTPIDLSGALQG